MRVLIVDDDACMAHLLEQTLRGEKFDCVVSHNGEEALRVTQEQVFDLVVLDLGLPGMSGLAFLRRLRASGNAALILIVSAHGKIEDRVRGLDFGADDYLVKNFSLAEFVARTRALMRRKLDKKHNILACGPLIMNFEKKEVFLRQIPLPLSKREFQILFSFLSRKNVVISREDLSEQIFGDALEMKSNVMDVHVRGIRKKLGGDANLLRTVRGHGYILSEKPVVS
jgi:DNA-binding response OmpR family regulator